jgi:hypothetical protein
MFKATAIAIGAIIIAGSGYGVLQQTAPDLAPTTATVQHIAQPMADTAKVVADATAAAKAAPPPKPLTGAQASAAAASFASEGVPAGKVTPVQCPGDIAALSAQLVDVGGTALACGTGT